MRDDEYYIRVECFESLFITLLNSDVMIFSNVLREDL